MSTQIFTHSDVVDVNKEKDWAASVGMMDWDKTSIVFTKRSLIEFLKYTGVTVDTNFTNISKLPRYAKFGKLSGEADPEMDNTAVMGIDADSGKAGSNFRPSRRVRTTPGGPSSGIFESEEPEGALADAPPLNKSEADFSEAEDGQKNSEESGTAIAQERPVNRPSRRVRTAPGGKDSLSELWGASPDNNEFKPTRRVRQGPGGADTVGSAHNPMIGKGSKCMKQTNRK